MSNPKPKSFMRSHILLTIFPPIAMIPSSDPAVFVLLLWLRTLVADANVWDAYTVFALPASPVAMVPSSVPAVPALLPWSGILGTDRSV